MLKSHRPAKGLVLFWARAGISSAATTIRPLLNVRMIAVYYKSESPRVVGKTSRSARVIQDPLAGVDAGRRTGVLPHQSSLIDAPENVPEFLHLLAGAYGDAQHVVERWEGAPHGDAHRRHLGARRAARRPAECRSPRSRGELSVDGIVSAHARLEGEMRGPPAARLDEPGGVPEHVLDPLRDVAGRERVDVPRGVAADLWTRRAARDDHEVPGVPLRAGARRTRDQRQKAEPDHTVPRLTKSLSASIGSPPSSSSFSVPASAKPRASRRVRSDSYEPDGP